MKFSQIVLNSTDPAKSQAFFCDLLGMRPLAHGFGYGPNEAHITFKHRSGHKAVGDEFFWKIGITLRDLDHAVTYLRSQGVTVSNPRQFLDIGYLAHLHCPSGHQIELLQQGFEGHQTNPGKGHQVGGQATLAHLTLRVRDLNAAQDWTDRLAMRLMSVQPVKPYGFTLYFYAWSEEPLPTPDLQSVDNRQWLWARPYTMLELQHLHNEGQKPAHSPQLVEVSVEQDGKNTPLDLVALNV